MRVAPSGRSGASRELFGRPPIIIAFNPSRLASLPRRAMRAALSGAYAVGAIALGP